MIAPLAFSSFSSFGMASMNMSVSASTVIQDFFLHLFHYPEQHFMAVAVMGVTVIAAAVGSAFLAKKIYEKCFPIH